ncbi:MAG: CaiB/BaiF CoA transferase family protein [Rudaea sp.]
MNCLEGIRVLDLSRLLPGPYATQMMANLGAEVIKVERPPQGDYMRMIGPMMEIGEGERAEMMSAVFAQVNRGKQSIALDFSSRRGRQVLLRLVQTADVLVESFRPGALDRRGLGYEATRLVNPRLVYCSLSGYGVNGPLQDRAGHDANYMALAGVLNLNANFGATPSLFPLQVADLAGGVTAAFRILAALVERDRTGQGRHLELALFDTAVDWMRTIVGAFFFAEGRNPDRGALPLTGLYPCYHIYPTSDGGYMSLGALEANFWRGFCEALGRDDLIDRQFDGDLIVEMNDIFRSRSRDEWVEFARSADVCLEPLLQVSETLQHPQVIARDLAAPDSRPVPRMGEHSIRVLESGGFSSEEIEELERAGVIRRDNQD